MGTEAGGDARSESRGLLEVKKKSPVLLKKKFKVDPEQGCAAMLLGCHEEGYKVVSIERRGKTAVVTYEKEGSK